VTAQKTARHVPMTAGTVRQRVAMEPAPLPMKPVSTANQIVVSVRWTAAMDCALSRMRPAEAVRMTAAFVPPVVEMSIVLPTRAAGPVPRTVAPVPRIVETASVAVRKGRIAPPVRKIAVSVRPIAVTASVSPQRARPVRIVVMTAVPAAEATAVWLGSPLGATGVTACRASAPGIRTAVSHHGMLVVWICAGPAASRAVLPVEMAVATGAKPVRPVPVIVVTVRLSAATVDVRPVPVSNAPVARRTAVRAAAAMAARQGRIQAVTVVSACRACARPILFAARWPGIRPVWIVVDPAVRLVRTNAAMGRATWASIAATARRIVARVVGAATACVR